MASACQGVSRTPFTSKRTTATAKEVIIKSHPVNEEIVSAGLGAENWKIAPTTANSQNTEPPRVDPIKNDGSGQ